MPAACIDKLSLLEPSGAATDGIQRGAKEKGIKPLRCKTLHPVAPKMDSYGNRAGRIEDVKSMNHNEQNTFSSDHLYLVAFLVCSGQRLLHAERDRGRTVFEFSKTPELLAAVADFMSGASIPARKFSFEILKLKRVVHGDE